MVISDSLVTFDMQKPKGTRQAKLSNAWLLSWEWAAGTAEIHPDKKIIAIIDARRSEAFIEGVVDILYSRSVDSAYDMALMANKRKQRESQYRHIYTYPSRISYGRRPFIYARRVCNLTVQWDESPARERLSWTEPAVFRNAKTGSGIEEVVPATQHEHSRSQCEVSTDIYDREARP